jgi:hypothetical protein
MRVAITSFRGVKNVALDLNGVTIIAGLNGSGKTSIAGATAAALTGEPPIHGVKKQDYNRFVHTGQATAAAVVETDEGTASITFPDGKPFTTGKPPRSSGYAAGIASPVDMEPRKAAEAWAAILETEPTLADLEKVCPDVAVITAVRTRGWDGALAVFKEDGAKLKGRWEQVTGDRYGTKKADTWMPDVLTLEIVNQPEAELQAAFDAAKKAHDEALRSSAIAGSEREKLEKESSELDARRANVGKLTAEHDTAKADFDEAKEALKALPSSVDPMQCPHCGKPVRLVGGVLKEATAITEEMKADRERAIKYEKECGEVFAKAFDALRKEKLELQTSEQAAEKLAKIGEASAAQDIKKTLDALDTTSSVLGAWKAYHQAKKYHDEILRLIQVCEILSPEGLRKQHLENSLSQFNTVLDSLCSAAGWSRVRIEPDLSISFGGMPYAMLSESEQYRTRVTVQTAIALRDKSDVLIFDRADILTQNGRRGLFSMSKSAGLTTIILMSASSREESPKGSLWIDGGMITT